MCEAFAYHRGDMRVRWPDYFAGTRDYVGMGALLTGADYVQAQRVHRVAQRSLAGLFERVDAIPMPTATTPAPTYAQVVEEGLPALFATVHVPYWNAVGNPVLAVPMGFTPAGLPLSLQIAARRLRRPYSWKSGTPTSARPIGTCASRRSPRPQRPSWRPHDRRAGRPRRHR